MSSTNAQPPPHPALPQPGHAAHCSQCNSTSPDLHFCAACRMAQYCSRACQEAAWPSHRRLCKSSGCPFRKRALRSMACSRDLQISMERDSSDGYALYIRDMMPTARELQSTGLAATLQRTLADNAACTSPDCALCPAVSSAIRETFDYASHRQPSHAMRKLQGLARSASSAPRTSHTSHTSHTSTLFYPGAGLDLTQPLALMAGAGPQLSRLVCVSSFEPDVLRTSYCSEVGDTSRFRHLLGLELKGSPAVLECRCVSDSHPDWPSSSQGQGGGQAGGQRRGAATAGPGQGAGEGEGEVQRKEDAEPLPPGMDDEVGGVGQAGSAGADGHSAAGAGAPQQPIRVMRLEYELLLAAPDASPSAAGSSALSTADGITQPAAAAPPSAAAALGAAASNATHSDAAPGTLPSIDQPSGQGQEQGQMPAQQQEERWVTLVYYVNEDFETYWPPELTQQPGCVAVLYCPRVMLSLWNSAWTSQLLAACSPSALLVSDTNLLLEPPLAFLLLAAGEVGIAAEQLQPVVQQHMFEPMTTRLLLLDPQEDQIVHSLKHSAPFEFHILSAWRLSDVMACVEPVVEAAVRLGVQAGKGDVLQAAHKCSVSYRAGEFANVVRADGFSACNVSASFLQLLRNFLTQHPRSSWDQALPSWSNKDLRALHRAVGLRMD